MIATSAGSKRGSVIGRYAANMILKARSGNSSANLNISRICGDPMRKWVISCILALGGQLSLCTGEESIREFRAVGPEQLEQKVPVGYGHVFVEAGRQNNIDPVLLAAISAHESGRWKSKTARQKNNWMGLMTRSGAKSFRTPEESIYYAADLLNRKPFKGRNTLSQIAPIYCKKSPGHWKSSVLRLEYEFAGMGTTEAERK